MKRILFLLVAVGVLAAPIAAQARVPNVLDDGVSRSTDANTLDFGAGLGVTRISSTRVRIDAEGGGGCSDLLAQASATTLAPGSNATADVTKPSPCTFAFAFGIPRGDTGPQGPAGSGGGGTPPFVGTVYVDDSGDDANSGRSWSEAKRTIQSAINAGAGTVRVGDGTYPPFRSGVRVRIVGQGTEFTQIRAESATDTVVDIDEAGASSLEHLRVHAPMANYTGTLVKVTRSAGVRLNDVNLLGPPADNLEANFQAGNGGTGLFTNNVESAHFNDVQGSRLQRVVDMTDESSSNLFTHLYGDSNFQDVVFRGFMGGNTILRSKFVSGHGDLAHPSVDIGGGGDNNIIHLDADESFTTTKVRVSSPNNHFVRLVTSPFTVFESVAGANSNVCESCEFLRGGQSVHQLGGNGWHFIHGFGFENMQVNGQDSTFDLPVGQPRPHGTFRVPNYSSVTNP